MIIMTTKDVAVSVANAKREFSDLLGRVAYGGETILITRRGRPMAKLVPVDAKESEAPDLASRGWLDEDDPFFEIVEDVVKKRRRHQPRALASPKRAGSTKRAR
jgi:prevent-host-death family protein